MTTTRTASQIAESINKAGDNYFGDRAKAWEADGFSRIYFGKGYVTIEASGEIHNRIPTKARKLSIGHPAVEIVEKHA